MSTLTNSLSRITRWMAQYQPDHLKSFQNGLSRNEIKSHLSSLKIPTSEEIYDLYQWRNGRSVAPFVNCTFSPNVYDFLSLNDVVDSYNFLNSPDLISNLENDKCRFIPLFGFSNPDFYGQSIDLSSGRLSSFLGLSEGGYVEFHCNSITSLLKTWADAYEAGAYRVIDEIEVEGHMVPLIEEDSDLVAPLLRKNNPGVAEKAVEGIVLLESLSEAVDKNVRMRVINALRLLQRYKHPSASNIISRSIERNKNLFSHKNQNILCFVSETLGDLSDKGAVKALTTILSRTSSEHVKLSAEDSISRLIKS